jgi:hypothetical protein
LQRIHHSINKSMGENVLPAARTSTPNAHMSTLKSWGWRVMISGAQYALNAVKIRFV